MTSRRKRFQWVWWGWLSWQCWLDRPAGNWGLVYRWRLRIGPVELRRWAPIEPDAPGPAGMTHEVEGQIRDVVAQCRFNDWRFPIRREGDRLYLQVEVDGRDNATGEPVTWRGRKWLLSPHMCRTEIVNTVFLAVEIAVRHEMCEQFRYRGQAVKNPHLSVDWLVGAIDYGRRFNTDIYDVREEPMQTH